MIKVIPGGVTAPKGFEAAGIEAGIKYENRKDMALIYSTLPCVGAGTFTSNIVKAAPVKWDKKLIEESPFIQAVVVNTGIANAGTGAGGMKCAMDTAAEAAGLLGLPTDAVLVGSTGVIGPLLPMDRIKAGIAKLVQKKAATPEAGADAARAIMTTDTHPKEYAVQLQIGGTTVTLGAISKGSGMIHPNMCTMLSFVCTDAVISKETLTPLVKESVVDTYNMISVDGDTSTNDTFVVMANGAAGGPEILPGTAEYEAFKEALLMINEHQAKALAGDGEGATALVECQVIHMDTKENAKLLAKSVISSSLTKAAIFGHDANWGRILCAMGYSGAMFDPDDLAIWIEANDEKILLCENGVGQDYSEEAATRVLSQKEIKIICDMRMGEAQATSWGCDLSYEYVRINGDYRS